MPPFLPLCNRKWEHGSGSLSDVAEHRAGLLWPLRGSVIIFCMPVVIGLMNPCIVLFFLFDVMLSGAVVFRVVLLVDCNN